MDISTRGRAAERRRRALGVLQPNGRGRGGIPFFNHMTEQHMSSELSVCPVLLWRARWNVDCKSLIILFTDLQTSLPSATQPLAFKASST